MAIEDAAVLGKLLFHISSVEQLPTLLRAYESLRLERTAETQASARLNQHIFHLPDGPEQVARDNAMREAAEAEFMRMRGDTEIDLVGNPNQWADEKKNHEQFAYDAEDVAEAWWREVGEREVGGWVAKAAL